MKKKKKTRIPPGKLVLAWTFPLLYLSCTIASFCTRVRRRLAPQASHPHRANILFNVFLSRLGTGAGKLALMTNISPIINNDEGEILSLRICRWGRSVMIARRRFLGARRHGSSVHIFMVSFPSCLYVVHPFHLSKVHGGGMGCTRVCEKREDIGETRISGRFRRRLCI
jgi:hypothetical protein